MSLTAVLGPELPYLRRYARALTGSQTLGDGGVREVLEALLIAPHEFDASRPPRAELYRVFHKLWRGMAELGRGEGVVTSLIMHTRQSLLLTVIEGFSAQETADILGSTAAEVSAGIAAARLAIEKSMHANVMIIEDEPIIALHISSIAKELGHTIAGIARTRDEAVALAARTMPELVLADISLADGSSGIDAVKDILAATDLPVIFITAFPERLLTGERPEPAFLITKPFEPETVMAAIGQALMVHRETVAARLMAAQALGGDAPDPRKHFDTPEHLLDADGISEPEKRALLEEWRSEMDNRLDAEAEGMSASDPISARREGRLADEASRVKTALMDIDKRQKD